jgi:hypothetical protein
MLPAGKLVVYGADEVASATKGALDVQDVKVDSDGDGILPSALPF